jgi:hypothetical protein
MGTPSTSIHKEGKQARTFLLGYIRDIDPAGGVMNYAPLVLYTTLLS